MNRSAGLWQGVMQPSDVGLAEGVTKGSGHEGVTGY